MLAGGWRWFTAQVVKQSGAKPVVGGWEEEEGEEGGKRASLALSLVARQGDEEVGPPSDYRPPTACLAP